MRVAANQQRMKLFPTVAVLLASAFADTRYGRFWPDDMTTTPDDDNPNPTEVSIGNGTKSNDDSTTTAAGTTLINEIIGGDGNAEQNVEIRPEDQSTSTSTSTTTTTTTTTQTPLTSPIPQRRTTYHMMAGVLGVPGSRAAKNTASVSQRIQHAPVAIPMTEGAIRNRGMVASVNALMGPRNKTALDLQTSLRSGGGLSQGTNHYVGNPQNQIITVATNRSGAIHVGRTQSLVTHNPNSKKYFNDLEYRL